jgi:tellurite resistance protein TerC
VSIAVGETITTSVPWGLARLHFAPPQYIAKELQVATNIWFWIIFNIFVLAMLALDLGVFHRHDHVVGMKEASIWTVVWISLALVFNAGIYFYAGTEPALQFLTGYLIEKSLSVDNIFVFVMLFSYFNVPVIYQHRVLFWGILGALIMRGILIGVGAFLIAQFHWIIYVFGAFLILTGIRMGIQKDAHVDVESNGVVKLLRRVMPITQNYHGHSFFVRQAGKLFATPLFVVLLIVETTDLIFALDSIPAIFAVTTDPFLVYTSNVFAILGLRSLYFLLAEVVTKFRFLKLGLSAILVFVGIKMVIVDIYHIPITISLGVIAGILTISILASLLLPEAAETDIESPV